MSSQGTMDAFALHNVSPFGGITSKICHPGSGAS